MKGRRAIPATELRVHLGEALRALDQEDIVVEKGGVPVAVITRYEGVTDMAAAAAGTAWSKAVVKPAEAGGWARAEAAMERGWSGISAEDLVESVRRARAEGTKAEPVTLDEDDEEDEWVRESELRAPKLVADERGEYRA